VKPIVRRIDSTAMSSFIDPPLKKHLDNMQRELAKSTLFAGNEMTAADVQMSFPLEAAASRGGLDKSRPHLMAFLERIHARPAYRRALERGGEYAYAS
jgi:glutathione S-transferase